MGTRGRASQLLQRVVPSTAAAHISTSLGQCHEERVCSDSMGEVAQKSADGDAPTDEALVSGSHWSRQQQPARCFTSPGRSWPNPNVFG